MTACSRARDLRYEQTVGAARARTQRYTGLEKLLYELRITQLIDLWFACIGDAAQGNWVSSEANDKLHPILHPSLRAFVARLQLEVQT